MKVEHSLSQQIRSKALDLGFSKVGFTPADRLEREGQHLLTWLEQGYHASMAWMAKEPEKRVDLHRIVPGVRSVVSVALNYYTEFKHDGRPDAGKISRYAWGDDYHLVLTDRLERLLKEIQTIQPSVNGKIYVDTGPVMEKVWAARAGLGWQGKHTNLITKEFGSWVFLGEILLDVELEYDTPVEDACGTCTACIDACPTQAIVQPYVVDSNKCISYLTIEHRGEFPADVSGRFEQWIYGCDICQDVCPWNRFQQPTDDKSFQPRDWNKSPTIDKILALTKEEFTNHFRKSPIKRTKRDGLKRNAMAVRRQQLNPS